MDSSRLPESAMFITYDSHFQSRDKGIWAILTPEGTPGADDDFCFPSEKGLVLKKILFRQICTHKGDGEKKNSLSSLPSLYSTMKIYVQCTSVSAYFNFLNVIKMLRLCEIVSLTMMHFEHAINSVKY